MDGLFLIRLINNEPITFPLGQGRVIPGWDKGIALLNKGAAARLVILAIWPMVPKVQVAWFLKRNLNFEVNRKFLTPRWK